MTGVLVSRRHTRTSLRDFTDLYAGGKTDGNVRTATCISHSTLAIILQISLFSFTKKVIEPQRRRDL